MTEADAFCCAFDKARNIGEHEASAGAYIDNAEAGIEGCEWIVRNLGLRRRRTAKKCRFACIREAEQPRIGDKL